MAYLFAGFCVGVIVTVFAVALYMPRIVDRWNKQKGDEPMQQNR